MLSANNILLNYVIIIIIIIIIISSSSSSSSSSGSSSSSSSGSNIICITTNYIATITTCIDLYVLVILCYSKGKGGLFGCFPVPNFLTFKINWLLTLQVEPLFKTGNIYYNYYVYTNNNDAIQQNIFMQTRTLILQFRALSHSITECKQWRNKRNLTQLCCVHALLTKSVNNKHGRLSTLTTIIIIILITAP